MGSNEEWRILCGTIVHSTEAEPLVILEDHAIGIRGKHIAFLEPARKLEQLVQEFNVSMECVMHLRKGQFLMPGLVDTHIHASQYVYTGTALDLPLLEWLEKYTFPTEARYSDVDFAEKVYTGAVNRVLRNGTTTACYFATIHLESTLKLCDVIELAGQRAFVGKVNMDQNSPDYYREETRESLNNTERFIQEVRGRKNPLLEPIVTPRFAISTTPELAAGLGELAEKYDTAVQSHIAENKSECEWIHKLNPKAKHYTDVYDANKLLTNKTVMAHGVYLCDVELDLFKERGAGISHCPNSNVSIRSGLLDARRVLDFGVKLGLGTDVSGGYHPSMFDAIRMCVMVSNIVSMEKPPDYKFLTFADAFRLATLGGCKVLGIDDKTGNFEVGKELDALVIDIEAPNSPFDVYDRDTLSDKVQKFLFLGDDRNISEVFVAGKRVLPQ